MEHSEYEKAPSSLLPALRNQLGLNTTPVQKNVPLVSLQAAFEDADWHKRVEAVLVASDYPEYASLEMLLHTLHDEDVSVRAATVHALGKRREDVAARLLEALHDSEWLVREAAVLTLGKLDERIISREQLLVALDDDNEFVQQAAHSVLDALPSHTAIETPAIPSAGFITKMLDSARHRFMFAIHARGDKMSQNTSAFNDMDSSVTIVELEPIAPATSVRPTLSGKTTRLTRFVMGGLAMLVVLAIVTSWLILLPRLHSARLGQNASPPVGTVLFKLPQQANRYAFYLPAWANDNKYLSFVDDQGGVYVWDSVTRTVKKTITLHYPTIDPDPYATWYRLPGGKYIVSTHYMQNSNNTGTTLHQIWNVVTGQTFLPANIQVYGWSNDGAFVAFIDNNNNLEIWNADTQTRLLRTSSAHFSNAIDITWSSDEQSIAIASGDGFMQVIDAKTGAVRHSFKIPLQTTQGYLNGPPYYDTWSNDLSHVIILPDGKNIASNVNTPLQVWDATTGQEVRAYTGHTATAFSPQWFNDGERVLSQSANEVRVWDALTGRTLFGFHNTAAPSIQPGLSLSPDNTLLLYNDGSSAIQVWDTLSGRELFTYRGHKASVVPNSITWSPDSTYAASTDKDGVLLVWNARTGALALKYSFHYIAGALIPILLTAWSPNGKMLVLTTDQDTVIVLKAP